MITNLSGSNFAKTVQKTNDKIGRAVELGANTKKTMNNQALAFAAGTGATILATNAVRKSGALQETITKGLKKITSSNIVKETMDFVAPYAKEAASWVKALPTPAKAVLVAGGLLTGFASQLVGAKGIANQGRILQKYEDKQAVTEALN